MQMPLQLRVGDVIQSRWEIHNILGGLQQSGMGVVYVVWDRKDREAYAAKTFQDEAFAASPLIAERFVRECSIWIELENHENIAQARFVENILGKPFLFLEYVNGGDLSKWIGTARSSATVSQILLFAMQFCDGMDHAFRHGVKVHRDVKPRNCLITRNGVLKVTDFGLAKALFDELSAPTSLASLPNRHLIDMSRTGSLAGTLAYMAPEQFDDAKRVDIRADVYSFGVMFYQMITGGLPFEPGSQAQAENAVKEFERLHKTHPLPHLPPNVLGLTKNQILQIESILHTCIAKDCNRRFPDFRELGIVLREAYHRLTGSAAPAAKAGKAPDVREQIRKATSLDNLQRADAAVVTFDDALSRGETALAWSEKAKTLAGSGRLDEALSCCDQALHFDPREWRALAIRGAVLTQLKMPDKALLWFERAIEINREDPPLWCDRASALTLDGRLDEAAVSYDRALELDADCEAAWTKKAAVLAQAGKTHESFACFERALRINPRSAFLWMRRGEYEYMLGHADEAIEALEHVIELSEATTLTQSSALDEDLRLEAWCLMGVAFLRKREFWDAIGCSECVLEVNAEAMKALLVKGAALKALQRDDEAIVCFDEARRLGASKQLIDEAEELVELSVSDDSPGTAKRTQVSDRASGAHALFEAADLLTASDFRAFREVGLRRAAQETISSPRKVEVSAEALAVFYSGDMSPSVLIEKYADVLDGVLSAIDLARAPTIGRGQGPASLGPGRSTLQLAYRTNFEIGLEDLRSHVRYLLMIARILRRTKRDLKAEAARKRLLELLEWPLTTIKARQDCVEILVSLFTLADEFIDVQEHRSAERIYSRLAELISPNSEQHLKALTGRAIVMANRRRFGESIQTLKTIIAQWPDFSAAQEALSRIRNAKSADELKAKQEFSEINADLEGTPIAQDRMDLFWLDRGVLDTLKTVVEHSDRYNIDATHVQAREGSDAARASADELFESVKARVNAGVTSLADMDWALGIDPIAMRAEDAAKAGDYAGAILLYRQALRQAPGCDSFLMSLGSCYAGIGQLDTALRYMNRAAEINPRSHRIAQNLASLRKHMADEERDQGPIADGRREQ